MRPQRAGGGRRSPGAPTASRRKWVLPERGTVHARTAARGGEGSGATSRSRGDPPREPEPPGSRIPRGSPSASSRPSVRPGIGYPLFPAGSLNRALATKTPPPLYLGAEGRRGEAHGSLASGRSGGSAAVSAGGGHTPALRSCCLGWYVGTVLLGGGTGPSMAPSLGCVSCVQDNTPPPNSPPGWAGSRSPGCLWCPGRGSGPPGHGVPLGVGASRMLGGLGHPLPSSDTAGGGSSAGGEGSPPSEARPSKSLCPVSPGGHTDVPLPKFSEELLRSAPTSSSSARHWGFAGGETPHRDTPPPGGWQHET